MIFIRMIKINKWICLISICNSNMISKKKKNSIGFTNKMIGKWDIYKALRSKMIINKFKMNWMSSKTVHNLL